MRSCQPTLNSDRYNAVRARAASDVEAGAINLANRIRRTAVADRRQWERVYLFHYDRCCDEAEAKADAIA